MSIFYENYLTEHGGAHRKADETYGRLVDRSLDNIDKFKKVKSATDDPQIIKNARKKYIENDKKSFNQMDGKVLGHMLRNGREAGYPTNTINNREAKRLIGAGKDNMPKNREAGTYSKLQAEKRKNLKEACEYILSMLEDED